ncbi:MAG TPA: TetR/AcrR family transcriptional regulator [Pseudonocardiaceae bacterium]|jgi:AcrR family transcriptional regulator|nr:TetR/AcrR family transcriptional regulator [Pseudonocardiaceae bacterium]
MDVATAERQALDAAEDLFYARGIHTVGMDDIRAASGVSLKRLYQLFPAKDLLVAAFLQRRDIRWRQRLADYVAGRPEPAERLLAVFDWLFEWFSEPGYRGCAWINSFGELGAVSATVVQEAQSHKQAFKRYLDGLVADAGLPGWLADHLLLLAEGAMVTAAIAGSPEPARHAREAVRLLMRAAAIPR